MRVVDKVDAVPDGFGVCGIALSFVTCSVFVVVGEYHAREGKEEFPAIGGFSWVGYGGVCEYVVESEVDELDVHALALGGDVFAGGGVIEDVVPVNML